jgi:hypothetical protein
MQLPEHFKNERRNVVMAVGAHLTEMLAEERAIARAELEHEIRSLRIETIELAEIVGELRKAIGSTEHIAKVVDLPTRRSTN